MGVGRQLLLRYTERTQQRGQGVVDGQRPLGHAEQVEEEHPAGKAGRTAWAARMAKVVFPSPAEPVTSPTTATPGASSLCTRASTQASSAARPVKSSTERGSSHSPDGRVR
ncbi:hypothetical protein ABTY98_02530 [Streptomyces sp. NPDC096040]|uniref:hypothetical protein n=1 Tax=Streptomyces sp. NPDC096040 TaxID=3155541 RepID=UPI003332A9C9